MKKNILLFVRCYLLAVASIFAIQLIDYTCQMLTLGYAWQSENKNIMFAVLIGGIPIGVGYFLLYKAFNQK